MNASVDLNRLNLLELCKYVDNLYDRPREGSLSPTFPTLYV